ncbi:unnamed protein product [Brassica rapa]|uniref:Uncharacterized protein n=1 Tax=Brassica campestris TaxID=3711 RepID=A0A8D9HTJ4_BRACM|nr:unnamed protein product [Brassica rapa]
MPEFCVKASDVRSSKRISGVVRHGISFRLATQNKSFFLHQNLCLQTLKTLRPWLDESNEYANDPSLFCHFEKKAEYYTAF